MAPQSNAAPPVPQCVRIVIADSRPIFRDGLRQLLQTDPRFRIIGERADASEAAALAGDLRPDILLLDFGATRTASTLEAIAMAGVSVRTIILADGIDDPDLARAIDAGARGFVLKESAAEVLFKGIEAVLADRYWIATSDAPDRRAALHQLDDETRQRRAFGLTPREIEIVRMVVSGATNKDIADRLSIGENTVKTHLTRIFNKLGASNRIELALFAAHHRLLDR
jgi:DNA-binding NarL/FixJ family response regulator